MLRNLTFNAIMWILIGLFVLFLAYYVYKNFGSYPMTGGFASLGVGCVLCGLTNGFTDHSPAGNVMRKFGFFTLIVGLPVTLYYVYLYLLR